MLSGLIAIIALVIVFDTRSRMKRLEDRLNLLERTPARPVEAEFPPEVAPYVAAGRQEPERPEPEPVAPMPEPVLPPPPPLSEPVPLAAAVPPALLAEEEAATDPVPAGRGFSFSFEDLFGRRLPIWAGGITLAIAGVLIVKYAIDAGLLTPWIRVMGGLLFGAALIAGAEAAMRNEEVVRDARVRQALSGAGLATLYATVLMASNAYGLIGPIAAFVLMAGITAGALGLSIRFGAPSALLGLAGGLATPALVGSLQPDVPLLSVYLALTIAGLAAVSRMQRWAWLGLSALLGGAGWSLWMIVATSTLDTIASLSIGGLVILLAIAIPLFALEGPRSALLRTASAIIGALQLAMLVQIGGFSPLHWGLFALIAFAGQWLAWREKGFDIVPTVSLGLSTLLLAIDPKPETGFFSLIGIAMALIHGAPLMVKLWREPPRERVALELSGLALATLIVPMLHFYRLDHSRDTAFAMLSVAAALVPALAIALGWSRDDRRLDRRFAWLTATAGLLLLAAFAFATPLWALPLGAMLVGVAMLLFGQRASDGRIEPISAGFAGAAILFLAVTSKLPLTEWNRLAGLGGNIFDSHAFFRWAGLAAGAVLFTVRGRSAALRAGSQVFAAALAYGAVAQAIVGDWLALVAPVALVTLALWSRRLAWPRLAPAIGVAAALVLLWAGGPVLSWTGHALLSLAAVPMPANIPYLGLVAIGKQLLVPSVLAASALWLLRPSLPRGAALAGTVAIALLSLIGLHGLYRLGFAAAAGGDFAATGLAQRLVWAGLLVGAGALVWNFARARLISAGLVVAGLLHTLYYSLLIHNPLWADQAVGPWPIANLLLPLFSLVPLGLWQLRRILPEQAVRFARPIELLDMTLIVTFAYATLHQAFHGSLLTAPGLGDLENILVSILALALAIGFLLWGIRAQKRDWRIASLVLMLAAVGKVFLFDASGLEGLLRIGSFVALGFSLIGISWLYSRQLASDDKRTLANAGSGAGKGA